MYVAEGGVVPTANKENWKDIGSRIDFASVNGIQALCDRDQTNYMECCEERSQYSNRPTLQFDGSAIDATNNWFNKNMSDIEIKLIASSQGNGFGETFSVNNATWNNITITQTVAPESVKVGNDEGKYHWISDKKNTILIRSNQYLEIYGAAVS